MAVLGPEDPLRERFRISDTIILQHMDYLSSVRRFRISGGIKLKHNIGCPLELAAEWAHADTPFSSLAWPIASRSRGRHWTGQEKQKSAINQSGSHPIITWTPPPLRNAQACAQWSPPVLKSSTLHSRSLALSPSQSSLTPSSLPSSSLASPDQILSSQVSDNEFIAIF